MPRPRLSRDDGGTDGGAQGGIEQSHVPSFKSESSVAIHLRMPFSRVRTASLAVALTVAVVPAWLAAQRGRGADNPFPGGTNPDGSLRPTRPVSQLFTQSL